MKLQRLELARQLARACLHFYPAAWRQRYADEVLAIIDAHQVTPRTLLDLLGGALDARIHFQTSIPNMLRSLKPFLICAAVPAYFVAYYVWFTVDEPLPSERLFPVPALWRQTEGFMNLSVEAVYFGLIGLSLLVGSTGLRRTWRSRHIGWTVAASLSTAMSVACGGAVLVGVAISPTLSAPPSPVVFLFLLIGGTVSSLLSIGLASSRIRAGRWLRLGITCLSLGVSLGMVLALAATIVFALDLTTNGVPIISSPGHVTIYGAGAVPAEGWGYNLRPTGTLLGNLGISVGLALLATVMSLAALRGTTGLSMPANVD